jgi:hypothetical protein
MNEWFKATVKIETEDAKGRIKYRKEHYLVSAVSPTDVEVKMAKHLEGIDYILVGVNIIGIVDVVK